MSRRSDAWLRLIYDVGSVEGALGKAMQAQYGIGLSEFRALEILSQSSNSELRMQELAARLGLNQSSVSRMIERLERSELAARDVCSDDKRGVYAVLTEKGRLFLQNARSSYEASLDAAIRSHAASLSDIIQLLGE
ncbi:HTH-type transcriptional regulator tcaR [Pannonibacter phragmitetus]|uniref:HTH-type transcriptional regulator tcaR n=1 Tax=Pannonibacter phragmitetus TaxID=121719 RepID=A0A378ZZK9_9HYPH|nr:MarR family transcriptional regulator [Pannonibacter phragmitetus]SUB01981.1 HTH-type transcriptional regulator tcaR [Pannonibacter phragmitetus]